MKTILILSICFVLLACKKEYIHPKVTITYTAYSMVVPYTIQYTKEDFNSTTETVNTQHWSKSFEVDQIDNYMNIQVKNIGTHPIDTIFARIDCQGSFNQNGSKFTNAAYINIMATYKIRK